MKKAATTNTIESSFSEIDKIINQMEDDKCSIEKASMLYEKGIKLINEVEKKVEKIETDIKIIGEK